MAAIEVDGLTKTYGETVATRAAVAERVAIAVVFGLFLLESVTAGTDVDWLGRLSPTHYYDPTAVLVGGTYEFGEAGILVLATLSLLGAGVLVFRRRDL